RGGKGKRASPRSFAFGASGVARRIRARTASTAAGMSTRISNAPVTAEGGVRSKGRVRRCCRQHPLPEELLGYLSTQAAQASNNVPAWYDPVRLRRPTTPLTGRGHPIGLGG